MIALNRSYEICQAVGEKAFVCTQGKTVVMWRNAFSVCSSGAGFLVGQLHHQSTTVYSDKLLHSLHNYLAACFGKCWASHCCSALFVEIRSKGHLNDNAHKHSQKYCRNLVCVTLQLVKYRNKASNIEPARPKINNA